MNLYLKIDRSGPSGTVSEMIELIPSPTSLEFIRNMAADYEAAAYELSDQAKDIISDTDEFDQAASLLKSAKKMLDFKNELGYVAHTYQKKLLEEV